MRSICPLLLAAFTLTASCAFPVTETARGASPTYSSTDAFGAAESRIFDLINAQRRGAGLAPLVYNAQLDQMAKIQSLQMAQFQKMAHVLPEAELPTLTDRAQRAGYPYGRIAENVALGYPTAESVVDGWMASKGHRANILNRDVLETGIGIARSKAGGLYYCQVFGRQSRSL
ncbi:MAG: CAP domain-containing protein [Gemmatimonadaceae bacterium]